MSFLERRVHGIETEYGLGIRLRGPHGWRRLGSDEAGQKLFAPVVAEHAATGVFLRNGGRLYLDIGSHPEYASAECASLLDLIAQDRAGDRILNRLADRVQQDLADDGSQVSISLIKNNTDSHNNSYGSHENFQITRNRELDEVVEGLTPFLVTRQLICGAGRWVPDVRGGHYELSQRAGHMWDALGSHTTRSRPLVNTRDEPHADPRRFRRLHVLVGDSSLSQVTLWLRFAATELVLRALEDGQDFTDLAVRDPQHAIRSISADLGFTGRIATASGELPAVEVQRRIWSRVADFAAGDPQLVSGHQLWDRVLTAIEDRALHRVSRQIDWAIKLSLLERWRARQVQRG